jgi:hypothetical protein
MTREQIIWQVGIGVFLLALGATAGPLLKRAWTWMNRPTPLTPQSKGQLVTYIATQEYALERLNYFSTHPKDLFLYLFQIAVGALICFIGAFASYVCAPPSVKAFVLMFLLLAVMLCLLGLFEAGRMSDKKIDTSKKSIQKSIDDANTRLNTPGMKL